MVCRRQVQNRNLKHEQSACCLCQWSPKQWLRNASVLYRKVWGDDCENYLQRVMIASWCLPEASIQVLTLCSLLSALFCHEPASSSNPRISAASLLCWLWNGGFIEDHTLVVLHTLGSCLMLCTVLHCTVLYCTLLCYNLLFSFSCGLRAVLLWWWGWYSNMSCPGPHISSILLLLPELQNVGKSPCPYWTTFLDLWSFIPYNNNKLLGQLWKYPKGPNPGKKKASIKEYLGLGPSQIFFTH